MTGFKIAQLISELFNNVKCEAKHRLHAYQALKDNNSKAFFLACSRAGINSTDTLCLALKFWPQLKAETKAKIKAKAEAKAQTEAETKAEAKATEAALLKAAFTELKKAVPSKRRGKFASAFETEPVVPEVEETHEAEPVDADEADANKVATVIETVIAKPKALTTTIVVVGGLFVAITAGVATAVITPVGAAALVPVCGVSAIGGVYSIVTS